MREVKEEKKTFWGRVKSWFVNIWNKFKSLFSSNKSKATVAAESSNVIPTPTEGQVEAVQQVATEPNMETSPQQPEGETPKAVNPPATPEMPEEAKKGESEKPVISGDGSKEKPTKLQGEPKVPEKSIGKIYENGRHKLVLSLGDEGYSILEACQNSTKPEEFCVPIKCNVNQKEEYFLITGLYKPMQKISSSNVVTISSVANQDGKDASIESLMKEMLGMNPLMTEVKVEISKAPEVKSPPVGDDSKGNPNPERTGSQEKPKKNPPVVQKKPGIVGLIKVDGSYLKLVVRKDCKSFDKSNVAQNGGDKVYVTIGKKAYCVIVNPFSTFVGGDKSFIVNSVKFQGESKVSSNPHQMKDKLGLNDARTSVEITRISDKPFPEVESPDQANSAKPDGETPTAFLETVDLKVQQQVADNGQSVPKAGNSRS